MATILIIDDDREVREMIAVTLEPQGHQVLAAENMTRAKELLTKRLPDLILLDLIIETEHDGLNYLSELLQTEKTKDIPVIVVSALRQKKKIVEGLKAGAIDYITKPFDPVELRVRVTSALKVKELKLAQARNASLMVMRETARTVQNEIDLPMREIQKGLIQLRSEAQDFTEKDAILLDEAWKHFTELEDILEKAIGGGKLG